MWQEEVAESAVQGQAARMRRAAAEEEEREAVRELDRVQAEGPANHRKRDPIDKVRSAHAGAHRSSGKRPAASECRNPCARAAVCQSHQEHPA